MAQSVSLLLAVMLGTMAAYYGGRVDDIIMRFAEIVMMFPGLILIIIIVAFIGPSFLTVMFVLGFVSWPGLSRVERSQILSLREWDFVMAARCVGVRSGRIVFRHILPNAIAPVIVAATMGLAGAIMTEAGLSFLGLGLPPPTVLIARASEDGALPEGAERIWCVVSGPDGWDVYWAEDGARWSWTRFDEESSACLHLFGRLAWTQMLRGALGTDRR